MKEENENITETIVETDSQKETPNTKKKISKTWAWAISHVGFIDEVTDPELRSQLVNYRHEYK